MNAREKYVAQYKAEHPEYTINLVDMIADVPAFKDLESLKFILAISSEFIHDYLITTNMIRGTFSQGIKLVDDFNRAKDDKRIKVKKLSKYTAKTLGDMEELINDILSERKNAK